jgi:hypothetical protein
VVLPTVAQQRVRTLAACWEGAEHMSEYRSPVVEQFVLTVGDIGVTQNWVVTPSGTAPLRGSQWIAEDRYSVRRRIPNYAIVLAVICAFFFLLGLLFLLIKEDVTTGYVQVTVRSGTLMHQTQMQVSSPAQAVAIRDLVARAQSLAALAA